MYSINDKINAIEHILSEKNTIAQTFINKISQNIQKYNNILDYYYYEMFKPYATYSLTKNENVYVLSVICRVPKYILAQINTHRTLSKNSASSRALSFRKMLDNIIKYPAIPIPTLEQKGMKGALCDNEQFLEFAENWLKHFFVVLDSIRSNILSGHINPHKEVINRFIESFATVKVIITGNISYKPNYGWDNFVQLRYSHDAQSEIYMLARYVHDIQNNLAQLCQIRQVHEPFGSYNIEFHDFFEMVQQLKKANSIEDITKTQLAIFSKIARVSTETDKEDIDLTFKLYKDKHMSPFEHVLLGTPNKSMYYNFYSFIPFRYMIEN
jgi:thymidylate synthase ThyX